MSETRESLFQDVSGQSPGQNPQSAIRNPPSGNPPSGDPPSGDPRFAVQGIFARAFRRLKPRTPAPAVEVVFRPFANVNSTIRLSGGRLEVKLSDILEKAPAAALEALAFILLSKLYRRPVPPVYEARYRRFLGRQSVRRQVMLVRRMRGRKQVSAPQGRHYNLEEIFEELNRRYFFGLLAIPLLSWSRAVSRTMLGHFDPALNTIIISRLFDSPGVPRCVLEYIVYHEMLHLKHPVQHSSKGRRRVHTREFREEEKRFARFEEARLALRQITSAEPD